jgi:hypothetical protein
MNTNQVRKTMIAFKGECIDPITGELNCTLLAEMAARELNLYVGDDIPEEVFDLAVDLDAA